MRRVFPCWDEPGIKAIFNITITHPKEYRAFSSMPITVQSYEITTDIYWTPFADTSSISASYVPIILLRDNLQKSILTETDRLLSKSEVSVLKEEQVMKVIRAGLIYWDFVNIVKVMPDRYYILFPNIISKSIGYPGLIIYRYLKY